MMERSTMLGFEHYTQEHMKDLRREADAERLLKLATSCAPRIPLARRVGEQLAILSWRLLREPEKRDGCRETVLSSGQVLTLCDNAA
jgi:hypothetical protein